MLWRFLRFQDIHICPLIQPLGQILWHNTSRMSLSSPVQHIWYCRSPFNLNFLLEIEKSRYKKNFLWSMDYTKEPNLKSEIRLSQGNSAGWESVIPPSLHRTNSSCQAADSSCWECAPVSMNIFNSGSVQGPLHWPRPWHTSKRLWATLILTVHEFFSCSCFQKLNQERPQCSEITLSHEGLPDPFLWHQGHLSRTLLSSVPSPVHGRKDLGGTAPCMPWAMSTFQSMDKLLSPGDRS